MKKEKTRLFALILVLICICLALVLSQSVSADGGVLIADYEEHVYLPSQKAAILWDGTNETMIISTKISSDTFSDMAWVIPIPSNSTPEVSEGDIEIFNQIANSFGEFEWKGGGYYAYFELFIIAMIFFAVGIIVLILSILKRKTKIFPLLVVLWIVFMVVASFFVVLYIYSGGMIGAGGMYRSVEVIEIKKVDIYDVAVLQATNASEMVNWLNENEFVVPMSSTTVLEEYCNLPDFYFVVNKINLTNKYTTAEEIEEAKEELRDGIATPLKIKFQPVQPFYPLQMTSINEGTTKINVYVISDYHFSDNSGYLSIQEEGYDMGFLSPEYYGWGGDYITWLTYEGETGDLTGDSYFIEKL